MYCFRKKVTLHVGLYHTRSLATVLTLRTAVYRVPSLSTVHCKPRANVLAVASQRLRARMQGTHVRRPIVLKSGNLYAWVVFYEAGHPRSRVPAFDSAPEEKHESRKIVNGSRILIRNLAFHVAWLPSSMKQKRLAQI